MAPVRRSASWSLLTRARTFGLLAGLSTAGLAAATAYYISDGFAIIGAALAGAGAAAACAGIFFGQEEVVLWGSLPASAGACLCGTGGMSGPDPLVLLGMTGASLSALALYELGTTAALIASYIRSERPREKHDIALLEGLVAEQARGTFLLLGLAFLLTMAVFALVFYILAPVPASPAAAGMFGALALTGAAAVFVLRGGKFGTGAPKPTSASSPVDNRPPGPAPGPPSWGWGPGR